MIRFGISALPPEGGGDAPWLDGLVPAVTAPSSCRSSAGSADCPRTVEWVAIDASIIKGYFI